MKLLTWNVQWFCGLDGVVDMQRVVDAARALCDFDVLCLQEVTENRPRLKGAPQGSQPRQLRTLLPGFEVFFGAASDDLGPDGERQRFGNLIATRLAALHVRHVCLPQPPDAGVRSMPRMCTEVTVRSAFGPVRVMTTHLEFYSAAQRLAQAEALQRIHAEACGRAAAPPAESDDGSAFSTKHHTAHAILCGDFNVTADTAESAAIQQPVVLDGQPPQRLHESWPLLHGEQPRPPTFMVHDKTYGPEPISCDLVFLSTSLAPRLTHIGVDGETRVSDHQPVCITLADT